MNLIDLYYYNIGHEPTKEELESTTSVINHLYDNGFSTENIIEIIKSIPYTTKITHEDLPYDLWIGSLLDKNVFYYHKELHITSPAPYWDIVNNKIVTSRFFMEMKIKYTIEDLINYYYRKFPDKAVFSNNKKDTGAMEYLLKEYRQFDFIEPVDFLLFLIDEAARDEFQITEIIQLDKYKAETYKFLKAKTITANVEKNNKIVWR